MNIIILLDSYKPRSLKSSFNRHQLWEHGYTKLVGVLLYKKDRGVVSEILKRSRQRYCTNTLFCRCGSDTFSPLRGTNSKITLTETFIIFNSDKDDCFEYPLLANVHVDISRHIWFSSVPLKLRDSSLCGP